MKTYSVSVRLQRIATEYAYVQVPVTSEVIVEQEDGTGRLGPDRLFEQAVKLGLEPGVAWYREGLDVHVHSVQKGPEPEETSFVPEWPDNP